MKRFMNKIDTQKFFHYLLPTMIFIIVISILAASRITQARYETDTNARVLPSIAFFVVGLESQNKQIKLESIVPRTEPFHRNHYNHKYAFKL